MSVVTEFEGLNGLEDYFKFFPNRTARAARLAINTVLNRSGIKMLRADVGNKVNFPDNYLKGDRLAVKQNATEANLVGIVRARQTPTSLARFAAPGTPLGSRGGAGVRVAVKRGQSTFLRNAWLVRLRKGASLTQDNYNIGIAVRLKPGEKLNKTTSHRAWLIPDVVALLYGPSVDQVFRDVAEEDGQKVLGLVSDEFFRQFERLK